MDPDSPPAALLTFEEARVLGCLIEKERTTPDYYPQTLNQVLAACNQSTNREPVVSFDERTVLAAIEGLKAKQLAFQVTMAGARVQKYKHNVEGKFPRLEKPTSALLCVLLLRGPQTAGELRQRSERLHAFPDLPAVEAALRELIEYRESPLVTLLPPGGGRKSTTYAHLLCGAVEAPAPLIVSAQPARHFEESPPEPSWKEKIESELEELRAEVAALRDRVNRLEEDAASEETRDERPASDGIYVP